MKRDAKFDPREAPAYRLSEAAHYLGMSPSTLRAWTLGQRGFRPVIGIADPQHGTLSFVDLVEAHVLAAIRRKHGVTLMSRSLADYLATVEREFIQGVLQEFDGQITRTAEALSISRKNLWERMRRLGLSQGRPDVPSGG